MTRVLEFNDLSEMDGYRLAWRSLLGDTRNATYFQTLDWLEVFSRHFGAQHKLRVMVVEHYGELMGILPLVVRREQTKLGSFRVLTYPLADWGTFFAPIGRNAAFTLRAAARHIAETPRDWDLFDLRWIDTDGLDHGRTPSALKSAGFSPLEQPRETAALIELRGSWESYWKSRSPKWRHNVERIERKLHREAEVTYTRYTPRGSAYGEDDPNWELYDACEGVARASWQGDAETGTTLSHHEVCDYLRDAHVAAANAGAADVNVLWLDGQPAAFAYGYRWNGYVFCLRIGYDPAVCSTGAGTLLTKRMLEDSFAAGDKVIDLGPGSLGWKAPWQTKLVRSYRYTHFPLLNPRGQLLRLRRMLSSFWPPEPVELALV